MLPLRADPPGIYLRWPEAVVGWLTILADEFYKVQVSSQLLYVSSAPHRIAMAFILTNEA